MTTAPIDLTTNFTDIYFPNKALLFYEHHLRKGDVYIESFDCNKTGRLINAHPLTEKELNGFAEIFKRHNDIRDQYLQCEALLPPQLLYLNNLHKCAIWYSLPEKRDLLFTDSLELENGALYLPSLIWKATATNLYIYACQTKQKPNANTLLYHAPFYNIYDNGNVCMGTVDVNMEKCAGLYEFISNWQEYFFNSKFSHVIGTHQCTRSPIEQVYRNLLHSEKGFPPDELISTKRKLKDILP